MLVTFPHTTLLSLVAYFLKAFLDFVSPSSLLDRSEFLAESLSEFFRLLVGDSTEFLLPLLSLLRVAEVFPKRRRNRHLKF